MGVMHAPWHRRYPPTDVERCLGDAGTSADIRRDEDASAMEGLRPCDTGLPENVSAMNGPTAALDCIRHGDATDPGTATA